MKKRFDVHINAHNLKRHGFVEQYPSVSNQAFWLLKVTDRINLTVKSSTLVVSLHNSTYGQVDELPHIKTVRDLKTLLWCLGWVGAHHKSQLCRK